MKGNFILKGSILVLFFSFCCLKPTSVRAQCTSGIVLKEVIKADPYQEDGSIAVNIATSGAFECALYRMTIAQDILIEKVNGQNNQTVVFESLPPDNYFKVVVMFSSEEDLKCRKRQITNLSTLE